jgi:thiosulfate/3-mercaptopyruvate sulfurtransferase
MTVKALASQVGDDDLVVLDARDPAKYHAGHIPCAVNLCPYELEETVTVAGNEHVPHMLASPESVAHVLGSRGIHLSTRVCIYDEGGSYRAARLWWILDYLGHKEKTILDGGFDCWEQETAAVEFAPNHVPAVRFYPAPRPPALATFADVIGYLWNPRVTLCNSLPQEEYEAGTLPSSISLPFTSTYASLERPLLKSRHELASMFARAGVSPDTHVVCFCGVGYSAAQLYFALKLAGYNSVGLYDGSMSEWSARGGQLVPGRSDELPQ